MSAVSDILFLVGVFREHGIPVTFEPGWETRGNGQSADYIGGIVHHTATPYSDRSPTILRDGRPDLDGPLCNLAGLESGGIHVVAAHPANHAGASGGPGNGPFPVTGLFNRLTIGLEIVYPGNSPMRPAQYRTAQAFCAGITRLRQRPSMEWTRAHAETSREGKWDPGWAPGRTIDMGVFRADAANLQEDDMTPEEHKALMDIRGYLYAGGPDVDEGVGHPNSVFGRVTDTNRALAAVWESTGKNIGQVLAVLANRPDVTLTPEQVQEISTHLANSNLPAAFVDEFRRAIGAPTGGTA